MLSFEATLPDMLRVHDEGGESAGTVDVAGVANVADAAPLRASTPQAPIVRTACDLAAQLRAAVATDNAHGMTFEALQDVFSALCEFYAADVEERGRITPLRTLDGASATSVLVTTTGLLRGANLELFELGMWQTWSGLK